MRQYKALSFAAAAAVVMSGSAMASSFVEGTIEGTIGGLSEGASASSGSSSGDGGSDNSAFLRHNLPAIVVHAARGQGDSLAALSHLYQTSQAEIAQRLQAILPELMAAGSKPSDALLQRVDQALRP